MAHLAPARALAVPCFHVVFTLPGAVVEITFQNKETVYATLFYTAADTLPIIATAPKHLGAEIGLIGVLHTWGQNLQHHPHVHSVVPGGGPSLDGRRWVACRPGFFGELAPLAEPAVFGHRLNTLHRVAWVVYAKPSFGGPKQALAYLSRYIHRVAIANARLVSMTDGVAFRWRDYHHRGRSKIMTLGAGEFIRRFLLRTLPDGFHRVCHFGFLANGHRLAKLALCRSLLDASATDMRPHDTRNEASQREPVHCRCCGGSMILTAMLPPLMPRRPRLSEDSS